MMYYRPATRTEDAGRGYAFCGVGRSMSGIRGDRDTPVGQTPAAGLGIQAAAVAERQKMITSVTIQNYRSILNASISLAPFTLLIGANGTGKSNFLQLLKQASRAFDSDHKPFTKHLNHPSSEQLFTFTNEHGRTLEILKGIPRSDHLVELKNVAVFSIDPSNAGRSEELTTQPTVQEDGSGVVQVLDGRNRSPAPSEALGAPASSRLVGKA